MNQRRRVASIARVAVGVLAVMLTATACATAPSVIAGPQITLPPIPGAQLAQAAQSAAAAAAGRASSSASGKAATNPTPSQGSGNQSNGGQTNTQRTTTRTSSTPKTSPAGPRSVPTPKPVNSPAQPDPTSSSPSSPPPDPTTPDPPSSSPAAPNLCGAPTNTGGYNFCGTGNTITGVLGDTVCALLGGSCGLDLDLGGGYLVVCVDGLYSMTGGTADACSGDGGVANTVYDGA